MELRRLAGETGVDDHVTFLRSFSDAEKRSLLTTATCLLYTPDREHFGIVPVEAMYLRCPVIAVSSGGPLETVSHNQTGFLCDQTPERFAEAMQRFVRDSKLKSKWADNCKSRMIEMFSYETYKRQMLSIAEALL